MASCVEVTALWKIMVSLLLSILFLVPVRAVNEDLLTALAAQNSVTKFTSMLSTYPSLLAAAQQGDMTVLAPTDAAFNTFFSTATAATNFSTPDAIGALLSYHLLRGVWSQASISSTPTFITTLLLNSSYANVTGGQVVEAVSNGNSVVYNSAVNRAAKLLGPQYDIIFLGGLIHIVDAVLTPPFNPLRTFTETPLPYFIDLLSPSVLNGQYNGLLANVTNSADVTAFCANYPELEDYARSNGTRTKEGITSLINYAIIPGHIVYSSALMDGASFKTAEGNSVTITVLNGATYVNDAKITRTDILVSNGVLHIIDKLLNASHPDARPQISNPGPIINTTSPSKHHTSGSLSSGAKAGIGVGVALGASAIFGTIFLLIRRYQAQNSLRKSDEMRHELGTETIPTSPETGVSPLDQSTTGELGAGVVERHELDAKTYDPHELEAGVWPRQDHVIDSGVVQDQK